MNVREKVSHARDQVLSAEEALAKAKAELERYFSKALVELFNEYGFSVEANGSEGARLEIREITHEFTIEMLDF